MRAKFVAGNWKMFTNSASAQKLAADVARAFHSDERVTVAVCPPFPYLKVIGDYLKTITDPEGTPPLFLGAQNCYTEPEGAFTGEVSPVMLADVGCKYVILGHSERRHKLGETDAFISRKVHAALAAGLHVILCLGETLDERKADRTESVLDAQLTGSLAGLDAAGLKRVVLAYEPVWAIGTGVNATPEQAQQAHAYIRRRIAERFGDEAAHSLLIQYGGSMKPENAAGLLQLPDVDGGLIGGASLKADQFLAIVRAAL